MATTIDAYLHISPAEARRQWQRVLDRERRPRQEPYLPIEVVLAHALFWILDPHAFGGANIHRLPQEAHSLARTFRRSGGSLTNKMLNLEGTRPNCARVEPEVFIRYSADPALFAGVYTTVIACAREQGLGPGDVPDVLGLVDGRPDLDLLGQDELGTEEIHLALEERREEIGRIERAFQFGEEATTRLVEQRVRLGQHRFARQVLATFDHRCGFCGFAPRTLPRNRLLVASHIKPWAHSNGRERLDPRNGVAACPMHDRAFDSGLITVNGGMRIHRAKPLQVSVAADEGVNLYFGSGALQPRLVLPEGSDGPNPSYLRYHREHIFQREGAPSWLLE